MNIGKLINDFESAQKRHDNLDAGRARRALIAEARTNGIEGWSAKAIRIVTDDRGNLLPSGGYSDESN